MAEKIRTELEVPADSLTADEAREALRVWVINEQLQTVISVGLFAEQTQWGILLAEVAQHIAQATKDVKGTEPNETLTSILKGFSDHLGKSLPD
ncbi:MAG: DUF5076 domain-containing protein [Fimbriiglobus sp.]